MLKQKKFKKYMSLIHTGSIVSCAAIGAALGAVFAHATIGIALGAASGLVLAYAIEQES
ncbi:hypothetical protein [Agaribacterium haliotis]|uniref:hypothetical protein n=1 Tax=Agaribacterium haliotis TaxID=2013869 RepID=UPI0013041346|nr:hypothetical protein [Agaribacterium haliotis]